MIWCLDRLVHKSLLRSEYSLVIVVPRGRYATGSSIGFASVKQVEILNQHSKADRHEEGQECILRTSIQAPFYYFNETCYVLRIRAVALRPYLSY